MTVHFSPPSFCEMQSLRLELNNKKLLELGSGTCSVSRPGDPRGSQRTWSSFYEFLWFHPAAFLKVAGLAAGLLCKEAHLFFEVG